MFKDYINDLKNEFRGYNVQTLLQDILAGLTVAAVALPLALAFGVSSGADAGAGLITAIIAGLVIGVLSGGKLPNLWTNRCNVCYFNWTFNDIWFTRCLHR